jgi:hypothetical protein
METQTAVRDGRRDFDFLMGRWHVHSKRLKQPLSGNAEWYEFYGVAHARPVWGGSANFDEYDFDHPGERIQGATLRLYDSQTHQWSIYWATAKRGLVPIATVGSFNDEGVGEFFDREVFDGKPIVCRYRWTHSGDDVCRWEQAFSTDDGQTWETNWIMDFTRLS